MNEELATKPIDPNAKLDAATTAKDALNVSPTGTPVVGQVIVKVAAVLVGLAALVLGLPASGIALPPIVLTIATAIIGVGGLFGIVSPGVRK